MPGRRTVGNTGADGGASPRLANRRAAITAGDQDLAALVPLPTFGRHQQGPRGYHHRGLGRTPDRRRQLIGFSFAAARFEAVAGERSGVERSPTIVSRSGVEFVKLAVGLGLVYFLAARVSFVLRVEPSVVVFWPAGGIAAGALIALGRRARLPIATAVFIANVAHNLVVGTNPWLIIAFGLVGAGYPLLMASLIESWFGDTFKLEDMRRALGFFAATAIGAAIAAVGATAAVNLVEPTASPLYIWFLWFASSSLGIVTVAPLLIGLADAERKRLPRQALIEGSVGLVAIAVLTASLISLPDGPWATALPEALVFPLLLWIAIRCQPIFAAAAALVVGLTIIGSTTLGIGYFDWGRPLKDRILSAQIFVLTQAIFAVLLAAIFAERRRASAVLEDSKASLADALAAGQVVAFEWNALSSQSRRSDNASFVLHDDQAGTEFRRDQFLSRVHPEDRRRFKRLIRELRPDKPSYALTFRFERPDGQQLWLEERAKGEFDAAGRLLRIKGLTRDISEQKRAEEALAEREAQLAVFVEHAPVAIAMFDYEMRYLAVSRRFVVDYHLPPGAQLIGRSHYEVFPNVPQRWRDIHVRVLAGEELSQEEDQYTRYDGLTDCVRWSMVPWRRANGDIGGALLFAEIITKQVEARRALAESEARFRATFENAGVGVVLVGPDGTFLRVNDSFSRILGYSIHELETTSFQKLTHPDDLEASLSVLKKILAGEADSYCIEKRYTRKDGGIVWANLNVGCVRKADGAVDYFISLIEDITERKEAEGKLRKSEQGIRELLGALPAAVFVTDAEGRITYYNQAAVELWGRRPQLGKDRWSDLARPFSADGKPARLADCPTEIALRLGKSVRGLEAILERADGTRIPVVPYPTPLRDATGAIVGVVNMTVDISERQQAERTLAERNAQLALAGQAALVGSYVYDVNKDTIQISEGYATIHDLPEGTTETTIREWRSRVHPEDLARAEWLREQAFAQRRKEDNAEYRIILSTGELRWIERRGVISYGRDGRPQRVVGVNIDVTERKRAEQHQHALNAELDHRVKNVLATVSAIIAQTQEVSNSRAEFVTGLNSRINSLARTHELLSESNWRGASLAEIIRRELAPYTRGNTEAGGPSITLKAEATQAVATVLHELTTNAAKYGALSNRSGRVSVRWRWQQNGPRDRLVIEWMESGGPPVLAPSRSGYGTSIIRELIPFEFGGAVELSFATEGTRCRLEIPGEWAGRGRERCEEG